MEFEIELDLTREELAQETQVDILVSLAGRLAEIGGQSYEHASLALLAAAAVIAIRNSPSGFGVAPKLKDLMVDAMQIARTITKPPPRSGS